MRRRLAAALAAGLSALCLTWWALGQEDPPDPPVSRARSAPPLARDSLPRRQDRDQELRRVVRAASLPGAVQPDPDPLLLSGTVVDAQSGFPVGGAMIILSPKPGTDQYWQGQIFANEHGVFVIPQEVQPAQSSPVLVVEVKAEGYAEEKQEHEISSWPGGPRGLVIALVPLARLGGRVLDGEGREVEGARIITEDADRKWTERTLTDAGGRFEVESLPPGPYVIVVTYDDEEQAASEELILRAGEHRHLELVLHRVGSDEKAEIRGRVLDDAGQGLAFVGIEARPQGTAPPLARFRLSQQGKTHTYLDGTFALLVGHPGWYELTLSATPTGSGAVLARARAMAAPVPEEQTIVAHGQVVACTLRRPDGRPAMFSSYSFSWHGASGAGGIGMGGISSFFGYPVLRFLWPAGMRSVSISLSGRGSGGELELSGPKEACTIIGR